MARQKLWAVVFPCFVALFLISIVLSELLTEIGRGAAGIVYKARDRETQEIVAVYSP